MGCLLREGDRACPGHTWDIRGGYGLAGPFASLVLWQQEFYQTWSLVAQASPQLTR